MKCPFCGYNNISGVDECESCNENLSSLDGVVPRTKMEKVLMGDPISKMVPRNPVVVTPQTNILDAIKKMNEAKVGCVLVSAEDKLLGILTENDIVMKVLTGKNDLSKIPVSEVMTPDPETLSAEDTLAYAVNRMSVRGYRHIPILRDGMLGGIISVRDVLGYLSKLFS